MSALADLILFVYAAFLFSLFWYSCRFFGFRHDVRLCYKSITQSIYSSIRTQRVWIDQPAASLFVMVSSEEQKALEVIYASLLRTVVYFWTSSKTCPCCHSVLSNQSICEECIVLQASRITRSSSVVGIAAVHLSRRSCVQNAFRSVLQAYEVHTRIREQQSVWK